MALDVVDTLCQLVATPSVNPMGRDVTGPEYFEHAMTDKLEQLFQQMGLPCQRQQVAPQRSNIVAVLAGDGEGGPLIVFEAHQDTVPVDGMTIPPWSPDVAGGRVTGRGSCDIKGGMACMLAALSRLAEERPAGRPTLVMACSVNEEHGYGGATAMADAWTNGSMPLVPRPPDAVIVAEPTLLNVVVAHKGVMRWCCHTQGRAAHSSTPQQGDNAIYRMGRVLAALERYADEVAPQSRQHGLVGAPTLSVGIIRGGISVNTVPDQCTIEIGRRVLPGEDAQAARQEVIDFVSRQLSGDAQVVHETPFIASNGLDYDRNTELAARLSEVARAHGGPGECTGVPYGTDAPAFDAIGAPTVVFGPGDIAQAHTCDEWISVDQLQKATDIYYHFGRTGLAG